MGLCENETVACLKLWLFNFDYDEDAWEYYAEKEITNDDIIDAWNDREFIYAEFEHHFNLYIKGRAKERGIKLKQEYVTGIKKPR